MAQHPRLHAIPGGRDDRPRPDSVRHAPARLRAEPAPAQAEPLWREALGRRLRALRAEQRETLVETAGRAGVSPQYLSEVERGRKDPSSEMIAALAGALGTSLIGLTEQVVRDLHHHTTFAPGPASRSTGPTMLALAA
jgi:DNA-binding XRE family transcriptional regulator